MSYNITTWKTKKLEGLHIPLKEFYIHERKDWHPEKPVIVDAEKNIIELECACGNTITGILKNGILEITSIEMSGDGSGTFMEWIFKPALGKSSGILSALLIWEGGDSITRLTVKDGIINEKQVRL